MDPSLLGPHINHQIRRKLCQRISIHGSLEEISSTSIQNSSIKHKYKSKKTSLFGTALALAPSLLELELSQTVSAPSKLGVELGRALSQNKLELSCGAGFRQLHNSTLNPTPVAKFRTCTYTKQACL